MPIQRGGASDFTANVRAGAETNAAVSAASSVAAGGSAPKKSGSGGGARVSAGAGAMVTQSAVAKSSGMQPAFAKVTSAPSGPTAKVVTWSQKSNMPVDTFVTAFVNGNTIVAYSQTKMHYSLDNGATWQFKTVASAWGEEFQTYSMSRNGVWAAVCRRSGNYWVDIFVLNLVTGNTYTVSPSVGLGAAYGITAVAIANNGNLAYAIFFGGTFKCPFNTTAYGASTNLGGGNPQCIAISDDGNTIYYGRVKYSGGTSAAVSGTSSTDLNLAGDSTLSMLLSTPMTGIIYLRTDGKGLTTTTTSNKISNGYFSEDGSVIVASSVGVLMSIDKGITWTKSLATQTLIHCSVSSAGNKLLAVTSSGAVWEGIYA